MRPTRCIHTPARCNGGGYDGCACGIGTGASIVLDRSFKDEASIVRFNVLDAQGRIELWVEANRGRVAFSGAVNGVSDDVLAMFQTALARAYRVCCAYNGGEF